MKSLVSSLVVLFVLVSSAVVADRPALRAACAGVINNSSTDIKKCGDPQRQSINAPIPIFPGRFIDHKLVFISLEYSGEDAKEAQSTLCAKVQDFAEQCNFELVEGTPSAGDVVLYLDDLKKAVGEIVSTDNRADTESWGGSNHRSSSDRYESSGSAQSGKSTVVNVTASGKLKLLKTDKIKAVLASVNLVPSKRVERVGSSYQDSTTNSYDYSNRKSSYYSNKTSSSGSTYSASPNVAISESTSTTIDEALTKLVRTMLARGIDSYNVNYGKKSESVPAAKKPEYASGYSGDVKYIAVDE